MPCDLASPLSRGSAMEMPVVSPCCHRPQAVRTPPLRPTQLRVNSRLSTRPGSCSFRKRGFYPAVRCEEAPAGEDGVSVPQKKSLQHAVLMEVEGVLADVHRFGHRHAFNAAFQKLGLDCANWTEPVYADLLRHAGADEERMLSVFFERIGWPMALPTDQKGAFVCNLLQEKQAALQDQVDSGILSLRPGIVSFVDEVIDACIPLVILAAYSKSGEAVARGSRSLIKKLGEERTKKISLVGQKEVENSAYGQVVLGAGVTLGLDEELAMEAAKAVAAEKQRLAEEIASMLKLSVEVDTNFAKVSRKAIALLRAGAEIAGVSVDNCVLLAGGHVGVLAAQRIGMPCVAVRSSLTARAEFPSAIAVLEGFGAGSLTLHRLRRLI